MSLKFGLHDECLLNTAITMTRSTNTNAPTAAPIAVPKESLLSSAERVALIVKPSLSVVRGVPGVEVVAGVPGVEVVVGVSGVEVVAGVPVVRGASVGTEGAIKITLWA